MEDIIHDRALKEADFMIKTGQTLREIAKVFKVSKSTVHKDLHERLEKIDLNTYNKIVQIMQNHIEIRHIRGGESTKNKYKK